MYIIIRTRDSREKFNALNYALKIHHIHILYPLIMYEKMFYYEIKINMYLFFFLNPSSFLSSPIKKQIPMSTIK